MKKVDAQRVDMWIMSNAKYFEGTQIDKIRQHLLTLDESKWTLISSAQLKDPTTVLIVSILVGGLGIDRFMW